jgi:hypothetical protein
LANATTEGSPNTARRTSLSAKLFRYHTTLYHAQNAEKWKVLPKTLKWSNNTPEEMSKILGVIILMGQVTKGNTG